MRILLFVPILFYYNADLSGQGELDITEQCTFLDYRLFPQCMLSPFMLHDELVFKNEESLLNFYEELQEQRSWCKGDELPYIDFSKNILLSKWSSGGGCKIDYEYQVTLDSINKEIVYTVFVKYEGSCEMLGVNNNFVLIPVVTDDYRITCRLIENYGTESPSLISSRADSLEQASSGIIEKIRCLRDTLHQISMELSSLTGNDYYMRQKELELYGVKTYTLHDTTELFVNHDFKSKKLATIPPNSKVQVFDKYGYYLKVKYNGIVGWIKSSQIVTHEDIIRLDDKRSETLKYE